MSTYSCDVLFYKNTGTYTKMHGKKIVIDFYKTLNTAIVDHE